MWGSESEVLMDLNDYHEEFNTVLDESGEIQIGWNFSALPSQILLEMDPLAYEEQLRGFVAQKRDEYNQVVYQSFPAPIAFFCRQMEQGYDGPNHRLQLLRSTWESVIYVLYALVLGEVNFRKFSLVDVRVFNRKIKNSRSGFFGFQLGFKIEVMQRIIEYDQQNKNELMVSKELRMDHFETLKELNVERNSIAHLAALSHLEAEHRFKELHPIVVDLLFELSFLENVNLLRFINTEGNLHKIRFNRYRGHSLQKENYGRDFSDEEITEYVYLFLSEHLLIEFDDLIFNISPFLHFCEDGQDIKLAYFKTINPENQDEYTFELVGAREREVNIPKSNFHNCLDQTLGKLT